jgi:outer membrane protein TolC
MQIDVFALLAEARQRINSTIAAIEAQRDFWVASVDLDTAIVGGGAGAVAGGALMVPPVAAAGGDREGH